MIYQNLFKADTPYVATVLEFTKDLRVPLHFHYEFEIAYCISGNFDVICSGKTTAVKQGDIILIGSMTAHTFSIDTPAEVLTIEFGPLFLKENFKMLSGIKFDDVILNDKDSSLYKNLCFLMTEIIEENKSAGPASNLIITGNLYKMCAAIISSFADTPKNTSGKYLHDIEKALEMIYHDFAEKLTVEKAANAVGYGKANFCKLFKRATGMGFHEYLNDYRIKTACHLLIETDLSIEKTSETVGFNSSKTFCRIFKKITGLSPGQYRKQNITA